MAVSRLHTWIAGEILLASDLNSEFNNVLNNGTAVAFPATAAVSMGGFALNFDAASTIAMASTTSGVVLTGGTFREPTEDSITAFAGGGQGSATALSLAKKFHRVTVCATAADSVKLPTSTAGQSHFIRNDGAAALQVFGTSPDTINGVATGTGVPHATAVGTWYVCNTAGNWVVSQPPISLSGNFAATFTVTATTNVTLPTTGTLSTLAGAEALTNKTIGNTNTAALKDTLFSLQDDGDAAKQGSFQLSGVTTGNNRVLTWPDFNGTIATLAGAETLTNKTIAASTNTLNLSPTTNTIGGDVSLNNTGNYFDGPSTAQGTSGTWFAFGTVTLQDTSAGANFAIKLWDGTTVIASAEHTSAGLGLYVSVSLSGFLAAPAANIRISVKDTTSTSGLIKANASGNAKDSTLSVVRIA